MKNKINSLKKNLVKEDMIVKDIEKARDMAYWFSERF